MELVEMVQELNRGNYEDEVNGSENPVLVEIWGPRCVPCLALMPMVEELGNDYKGRVKVAKLNAAENRMLCAKMRVMSVPTFLLYKDGNEVNRLIGDKLTISEIKEAVEAVLE